MLHLLLACTGDEPGLTDTGTPPDPCSIEGIEADEVVESQDELLEALGKDKRILLKPGHYGPLVLERSEHDGVELIGACREEVVLEAEGDFTVHGSGWPGHASFEQLTVFGGEVAAFVGDGFGFTLREVSILDAPTGIVVAQSKVLLEIEDSLIAWPGGDPGNAITVQQGPDVTIRDLEVVAPLDLGFYADRANVVDIDGLTVTDRSHRAPRHGSCMAILGTRDFTLAGLDLQRCDNMGLYVESSTGVLRDSIIYGTTGTAPNLGAPALVIEKDSDLTVTHSVIGGAEGPGVLVFSTARFESVDFLDNIQNDTMDAGGAGLDLREGADVVLTDCRIENNTESALQIRFGARAQVTGTLIQGTAPGNTVEESVAVYLEDGELVLEDVILRDENIGIQVYTGLAEIRDVVFEDLEGSALQQYGGTVSFRDTVIRRSDGFGLVIAGGEFDGQGLLLQDLESGPSASAVHVQQTGEATLRDSRIESCPVNALMAWLGGTLQVENVVVEGLLPTPSFEHGYAVVALDGGHIEADGLELREISGVGVFVGQDSTAALDHVTVEQVYRTTGPIFAQAVVVQNGGQASIDHLVMRDVEGPGLSVFRGGWLQSEDFVIERTAFAGAFAAGGTLTLQDGSITDVAVDPNEAGGIGLYTSARSYGPAQVSLEGVQITDNPLAAVYTVGDRVELSDCTLTGGEGVELHGRSWHGDAVVGIDGAIVALERCSVEQANTGLFLHASAVEIGDGVSFTDNGVDLHMQACDDAPESTGPLPEGEFCPSWDSLYLDLECDG